MVLLKRVCNKLKEWVLWPYNKYKEHKEFKKKMAELKEKDPFIYK